MEAVREVQGFYIQPEIEQSPQAEGMQLDERLTSIDVLVFPVFNSELDLFEVSIDAKDEFDIFDT